LPAYFISQRSDVNESDFIIEERKYISVKEIYNSFISFCDLEYLNEREKYREYMNYHEEVDQVDLHPDLFLRQNR
jgi:hypothetical protein